MKYFTVEKYRILYISSIRSAKDAQLLIL